MDQIFGPDGVRDEWPSLYTTPETSGKVQGWGKSHPYVL